MKRVYDVKSNSGISLITVVITVIVIIILATVSFFALDTHKNAVVAKYVQEFEELRKSVETKRLSNAKNRS